MTVTRKSICRKLLLPTIFQYDKITIKLVLHPRRVRLGRKRKIFCY